MKLAEFEWRRALPAAALGAFAGSACFATAVLFHPAIPEPDYLGTVLVLAFFSFGLLLAITGFVEIGAMILRPRRNWFSLLVCILLALVISLPFWPPEMLGAERLAGEDPRHWSAIIYAVVTAVTWWWLLPTAQERRS